MQAIVEKERLNAQALLEQAKREAAERERELEVRTTKLLEGERNWNEASNRVLYELIMVRFLCILAQSCTKCSHY